MEVEHQKENHRFVLKVGNEIAKVDYVPKNNTLLLVHSEVPKSLRGQGIGKILVTQTFEKLTQEGYNAVAVCSYIKAVAQRSKKWNTIIS